MGAKAVTVNVSDILAMNSIPESIVISMGLKPDMTIDEFEELTDGILDKCVEYDIKLIGGDINQNTELVLCGTSIGIVNDEVKLQKGLNTNDLIAVTGDLGGPAASLDVLSQYDNEIPEEYKELLNSLLCPTLPFEESKTLRKYPQLITGITDITDGLAIELGHFHDKNPGVGFEIYFNRLPFDNLIKKVAKNNNKILSEYLLHFGEEFELLLTLNPEEYNKHKKELDFLTIIGKTNNSNKITLIKDDGEYDIPVKGYEHLKDD
jgi:thiamine-monophosphate kinase